jgi:hypothetical protein
MFCFNSGNNAGKLANDLPAEMAANIRVFDPVTIQF